MNLNDKRTSIKFYEDRYSKGYMEEWPIEKEQRIFQIIISLNLPETGEALDFGCGNGVFTNVIKQALPKWNVYGTDISSVAIENAKNRFPHCVFFVLSDKNFNTKKFDFLFSHHVLEHVYNISEVWDEINNYMKETSSMLHILPCGNEGSFDHKICLLIKDGINKEMGNRYLFEESAGHLRRLNTEQVNLLASKYGFNLNKDFYSNQYHGAIEWFTACSPKVILDFTNPTNAIDKKSAFKLKLLRVKLLLICFLRMSSVSLEGERIKNIKTFIKFMILSPFYPFSKPIDLYYKNKAKTEWKNSNTEKNGSEMYLYYVRV